MKRKLLSAILSLLLVFSMAMSVSASAVGIEDNSTTISPYAHDVEAKRELVNAKTLVKHPIGYAKGQPANGTVFSSPGGFYWSDGGFGNSVTLNLSLGWGPVSANVSVGSTGGTTGKFISSPYVNKPCKLFIYKDLSCKRYANYERLIGTTTWKFVGYDNVVTPTREYLEVKLV